ncbi:30S ribosomal protein S16 [Candidatus Curtissbacteria bacterium RIFCSPHIGHO2_01_FULL_41_11]|uniref:Small ribosomal subunit protein bS16 n=1 Tax=Candidatus Curtissbacteria bacterium RIFCSPHIGHO2_01_FULL_41_11 TaxID=1797711 RepID=A0A1F5G5S7_9BACT|nr:MAG: 30S ribosomal protein S16 [Candidatus Curtissbacteria bacterium RIFCSPHIGHO2_01_FULL_41_11]
MSVKIRLTRTGKSHQVSFRIVALDTRSKRDGGFLEILGFYNPFNTPSLEIDKEKLAAWTKKGAKPTLAVISLLEKGSLTKKVSKRKLARDKAKADKVPLRPLRQVEDEVSSEASEPRSQSEREEETDAVKTTAAESITKEAIVEESKGSDKVKAEQNQQAVDKTEASKPEPKPETSQP